MSSFFTILIISISLSMDAFSLALVYGLTNMNNTDKLYLSLVVGIYHFIMPLIGLIIGSYLETINIINLNIIASFILILIGFNQIITYSEEKELISINLIEYLLFGISVSIDSLTLGIGLPAITNNYLISASMFSITSFTFTYIGLLSGSILGTKLGHYSKIIGGIVLIVIALFMII